MALKSVASVCGFGDLNLFGICDLGVVEFVVRRSEPPSGDLCHVLPR